MWQIAPQFGDLEYAEAGFVTSLGMFHASWKKSPKQYTLDFSVPGGTNGVLVLPYVTPGKKPSIMINGDKVTRGVVYANDTATFGVDGGGSYKVVVN